MPKIVKKEKKGLGHSAGGGGKKELSPQRPHFVEKIPPCTYNCPNHNKVREALMKISKAESYGVSYDQAIEEAWHIFLETTPFPAVMGRVCPNPCETECNRKTKESALAVNAMERFIGDFGMEKKLVPKKLTEEKRPEKIAVIGSGPAGMSCAYQLARRGYQVTVFEAFPKAGGMLRYGIPAYRLPDNVLDGEIQRILDMGVELKLSTIVGKDIPYQELRRDYKAIFVGVGAHKGKKLGIAGDDAPNVWAGTDFLHRINTGELIDVGSKVVTVGGGDTAIDAARVALRLGAKSVILYRRTRDEMPAIKPEIKGAEDEGVELHFLAAPLEIYKEGDKAVRMKCQRMQLGEPDASGRRRPVPIEGDTFEMDFTTLIAAISQEPDFAGFEDLKEGKDWIKTDPKQQSKVNGVYSGGDDIELGIAVTAIYHGRRAAEAIHEMITGEPMSPEPDAAKVAKKVRAKFYEDKVRMTPKEMAVEERLKALDKEIASTMTREEAIGEAKRCMSCGKCFDCGTCWSYCQEGGIVKPAVKGEPYKIKLEICIGCNKCAAGCPCGYIEMR